jgi:hypothetical protein
MALVKFGGGVAQMSGSIGGTTFARNRSGNYARNRTRPVNTRSIGQESIRTALSYLTMAWASTLDATQRTAWATYATAVAVKNRLGESTYLTGFNHFVRANAEFYRKLATITEDGPTVLALPEKDEAFVCTGSVANQKISVAFNEALPWALEAGAVMFIYMGRPRQATRLFFNGPWNYMDKILGVASTGAQSPAVLTPPYTLVLGQVVTCYARIRRLDGRLSEPFTSTFTVAA